MLAIMPIHVLGCILAILSATKSLMSTSCAGYELYIPGPMCGTSYENLTINLKGGAQYYIILTVAAFGTSIITALSGVLWFGRMSREQRVRCLALSLRIWVVPAIALACAGLGLTVLLPPGQQMRVQYDDWLSDLFFYNLPLDTNPIASIVSSDDPYSNFQVGAAGIPEPCGIMVIANSDSPSCTPLLIGASSVSYGRCYSFDDLEVRPACEGEVVASRVVGYVGAVLMLGSLAAAMYVSWVQCCIHGCRQRRLRSRGSSQPSSTTTATTAAPRQGPARTPIAATAAVSKGNKGETKPAGVTGPSWTLTGGGVANPAAAAKAKQHEADNVNVNATRGERGGGSQEPQSPSLNHYRPTPVGGTVGEAYGELVPSAPPLEPPPPSSFDYDFVPPPTAPAAYEDYSGNAAGSATQSSGGSAASGTRSVSLNLSV